jgi:hypothetical protein
MQGMSDILPVRMQDLLHSRQSKLRQEMNVPLKINDPQRTNGNAMLRISFFLERDRLTERLL